MHLKGEVPFSADMRTEAKNFRTFFVHTVNLIYVAPEFDNPLVSDKGARIYDKISFQSS